MILQAVMQENMILTLTGIINFLKISVKREFKPNIFLLLINTPTAHIIPDNSSTDLQNFSLHLDHILP